MHIPFLTTTALLSLTLAFPSTLKPRVNKLQFIGINESGPEFGEENFPGVYGTDFTFPNLSTIDTFLAKGMNTFRINVLMERLVPDEMTGALNVVYAKNLTETVEAITGGGGYALIAPHNFGRYYGSIINSTSDFATFWKTVAGEFKSNEKVIFDTNNEYHDMSSTHVRDLNQAAINGIRAAAATTQYIAVEGNAYTGAWTWTSTKGTDGLTNADVMGNLTDSVEGKLLYEMHQYLDSNGSGTGETCVSETIGRERLQAATQWLKDNGKIGLLGELAGSTGSVCQAAVGDMLDFVDENAEVWAGGLWWGAGPWWADYMFSVEPTDGPAYETYMPILKKYA